MRDNRKYLAFITAIFLIFNFLPYDCIAAEVDGSVRERFLNLSISRDRENNTKSLDNLPADYQAIILKTFASYEDRLLKKKQY